MFAETWEVAAQVFGYVSLVYVGLTSSWFLVVNFLAAEESQPLDYYSNKLRIRPYWYALIILALVAVTLAVSITDQLGLLVKTLPELVVTAYLQGLTIAATVGLFESSAAALVSMLFYVVVGTATLLIVTIPTPPFGRPGVVYSNAFLVAKMVGVAWLKIGVGRHYIDTKPLPAGAERLPELWAKAVLWGNPLLLIILDLLYAVLWQLEKDNFGSALSISYFVVASLLLLGCCHSYRAGTELD
mmetsp:Transcript_53505/g.171459  ORF Transcript_53505/g.171459 Transcript_53505/m.171459 type:complete len:243 (+) Transcript_53505:132-860(+)